MAQTEQIQPPEPPGVRYDRMRIGYAAVSPDGAITEANNMFRRLTGLPEKDVPGQQPGLADAFSQPEVQAQVREHLAGLTPENPVAVHCIDMGERGIFQFHTNAAFSPEGKPVGYETATVDVSNTFASLSQALQAMTEERNTAHDIAHALYHDTSGQIRHSGSFAAMAISVMDRINERNNELSDEVRLLLSDARGFLQRVDRNAKKAGAIMAAYIELESISQRPFVPVTVEMGAILKNIKEETQESVERAKDTLVIPERMPNPLGKIQWVEQVWVNLVNNAAKYAGTGATIELGFEELPDGRVSYWVKDNGPGIDEEYLPRLFRKFTRLHPEVKDGTGLGLALVKTLVEKMGGQVSAKSRKGEGSQFYFILPSAPTS